jgi:hypothetical protein
MGKVFKKVFKPIQKLVPKSLRPYVPYAAAFIPGGMGLSAGLQSMGGSAFLKAAIARGMIDPDASIGDSLKTGLIAAAPQAIGKGLGALGTKYGSPSTTNTLLKSISKGSTGASKVPFSETLGNLATTASGSPYLNPEFTPGKLMDTAKVAGTLGTVEAAAQLAELNQEEIDKYNDSLGGNLDRGERRAQLTAIFTRAGYEPDYVDQMLTTYGYAQGGIAGLRSGYENGGTVTITQEEYDRLRSNKMGTKEGLGFATEGLGMLGKSGHSREPVPMLRFAQGGEVIEESETLMAGGPYGSGRDVQDAYSVWSGMGPDDKSLFEGFLDFYKQGSWRDQIMGQTDVEENTMMASAPSLEDSLNEKSLMMFRKPYYELTEEEVELLNEMATGGRVGMKIGGIMKIGKGISNLKRTIVNKLSRMTDDIDLQGNTDYADDTGLDFTLDVTAKSRKGRKVLDGLAEEGLIEKLDDNNFFIRDDQRDALFDMKDLKASGMTEEYGGTFTRFDEGVGTAGPGMPYGGYDEVIDTFYKKANGGIMNKNLLNTGMDKDMRGGGFIPEGTKEKADDVPARLSKNEFVMTADAVRAAGGGSVNKGAQRMYNIMNQLEAQA